LRTTAALIHARIFRDAEEPRHELAIPSGYATAQATGLLGRASSRDAPGALLDDPNAYVTFLHRLHAAVGIPVFADGPSTSGKYPKRIGGRVRITLTRLAKLNWRGDYGSICPATIPLWSASQVRLRHAFLAVPSNRSSTDSVLRKCVAGRGGALMSRCGFRRLRYAAASINLLGLILSLGTWGVEVWLRAHPLPVLLPINLTWTLGVFCWLLGLLMFIVVWIAEGFASKKL
jgi:hypothetical protein